MHGTLERVGWRTTRGCLLGPAVLEIAVGHAQVFAHQHSAPTLRGLALALLLNRHVRGIALYRTAFYLPMVLGGVAISLLWLWLFSPSQGLFNIGLAKIFDFLGQDSACAHLLAWPLQAVFGKADADSLLPGWISSERGALNSLILMSCWTLGGSMIVNLAGLQAIPKTYYEAAEIDGAGRWTRFWRITIPLLSPTTSSTS